MSHKPIFLNNVSLSFPKKTVFEGFTSQIYPGSRIAIIGRNGSGKSSLLNILRKALNASGGESIIPDDLCIGYVEQTINDFNELSGGERLNKRLSEALAKEPDLLLLDEPTNHLDKANRKSLMQLLRRYQGTLVVVSHDTELLKSCIDRLWHIDNHKIYQFSGSYEDYVRKNKQKRASIEKELASLRREKKALHNTLAKEQKRSKKRKDYGEKKYAGDKLALRTAQGKGQITANKRNKFINDRKTNLLNSLLELYVPEIIVPKFSLPSGNSATSNLISINGVDIGYSKGEIILKNVSLALTGKERIAICGKNMAGKSTLLKAILGKENIFKTGKWQLPSPEHIGYLDQHYSNLNLDYSVIDHVRELRPDWNEAQLRAHLNDFLFRKNEEVMQLIASLSGGEKARASLSLIAAKTPKLLILDETTNNLDLETKEHITQVLKYYPGAMILVSHEENFLNAIGVERIYNIADGSIISS